MSYNFGFGFSFEELVETICWKLGITKNRQKRSIIYNEIYSTILNILKRSNFTDTRSFGQYRNEYIWDEFLKLGDKEKKAFDSIIEEICKNVSDLIFIKFTSSLVYNELVKNVKKENHHNKIKILDGISQEQFYLIMQKRFNLLSADLYKKKIGMSFKKVTKGDSEVCQYLVEFSEFIWEQNILKWINEPEENRSDSRTYNQRDKSRQKINFSSQLPPKGILFPNDNDNRETKLQIGNPITVKNHERRNPVMQNANAEPTQQNTPQTQTSEEKKPVEVASLWKYNQVPENEPDKHTEDEARIQTSPDGMPIICARVRGKKHKHEGTNCDDWFEVGVAGKWTIIAVSDGAGSKKFSRVGAQASCQQVIQFLRPKLLDFDLSKKTEWNADIFNRDEQTHDYTDADIHFVEGILHQAMKEAYQAVENAFADRKNNPDYLGVLGRHLEFSDLSCTLLVALHSTVVFKGNMYHFVMSCHIGDGMIAAIDIENSVRLLAVPDAGDFSGETDFLTSAKKSERANLINKTFLYFGAMKVLMVMSDGVSDDYFPNDQRMLELYGDLVLNDIVQTEDKTEAEISAALENVHLALADIQNMDFPALSERLKADGNTRPFIRSIIKYSEKMGLPIPAITASPALLAAAKTGKESKRLLSEDGVNQVELRLKIWLDAYYVKGSFDDRTLVVMNNTLKNLPTSPLPTPPAPPPAFDNKIEIPPETLNFHMGGLLR